MEDHDIIPTCLSADPHKPRDFLLHYLGCEQFYQREDYLASLTPQQSQQIEAKLRRISYLRAALSRDPADPDQGAALVAHLTRSLATWRQTRDFADGIVQTQQQRIQYFAVNGVAQRDVGVGTTTMGAAAAAAGREVYNPDMDTNAYVIRFRHGRAVRDMMDSRFHQQFPSHRISIQNLVYDREDPALLNPPENTINYFHFPANNMFWAERFITRYLKNKPRPEPTSSPQNGNGTNNNNNNNNDRQRASSEDLGPINGSVTRSVLSQKYWKSQQQGSTATGKYLRPMCEIVSVSAVPEDEQQGIALFMPYLHWDTARHQAQISQAVQSETERCRVEKLQQEQQLAGMRRFRHRGLQVLHARSRQPHTAWRLENRIYSNPHHLASASSAQRATPTASPKRTATGAFVSIMKRYGRFGKVPLWSMFTTDGKGRVLAGKPLGQVLFDAAMLYETMTMYREKSLIRKYLHEDPPLHPRRTLEQTNEWTLSLSWHASARDQVVHRATRPKQLEIHSAFDEPFTQEWMDRIRKIPRVMMIDQLWLWILDDQTVITCFPDNGDLSENCHLPGLHRSIRDALMKSAQGHIKSALDVAILILTEAQISRSSLTMIKPQDAQLYVMQIFREAIRDVASKHSFGAEQYWEWARIFSRLAHTDVDNGLSDLIVPFLDIGKEGELQGQIKSVVRDLEIMLQITTEQMEVVEKFEKTMQQLVIARGSRSDQTLTVPDAELLLDEIQSSIDDLDNMRRSADDISASLDYLISLKQQQVTVVQAWQSMKQGEDNQKQNVTLLVFTVVTVIFLPMSFISSVFGMNNKEIAGKEAPMTLADQFKWMIPLSFAIVAITYYTAFGSPGRISRDILRWLYMKLGLTSIFGPGDLSWSSFRDRWHERSKQREKKEAQSRRRSEQIAKQNQERRQGRMHHGGGGMGPTVTTGLTSQTHHSHGNGANPSLYNGAISPGWSTPTPQTPAHMVLHGQQTGMFGIYQDMNMVAGTRRVVKTPEQVV